MRAQLRRVGAAKAPAGAIAAAAATIAAAGCSDGNLGPAQGVPRGPKAGGYVTDCLTARRLGSGGPLW